MDVGTDGEMGQKEKCGCRLLLHQELQGLRDYLFWKYELLFIATIFKYLPILAKTYHILYVVKGTLLFNLLGYQMLYFNIVCTLLTVHVLF
jgi:hypothetical protein